MTTQKEKEVIEAAKALIEKCEGDPFAVGWDPLNRLELAIKALLEEKEEV